MEVAVRFGVFIAVFLLMAAWEAWLPKRRLSLTRRRRFCFRQRIADFLQGAG
jgi:hypothetical protein